MGVTKTELFTDRQNELASISKALAHPARIAIIEYLLKANACINSHLVMELGLAQATISQHLRALKDADIIAGTIEGVSVSYCINPKKWQQISSLYQALFGAYNPIINGDCCE